MEKTLFSDFKVFDKTPFKQISVAYNLRFHPIIQRLKNLIEGEDVLSVQAYVGQYLPDWRPQRIIVNLIRLRQVEVEEHCEI